MGKFLTLTIAVALLGLSAAPSLEAAPRGRSQNAEQPADVPAAADPVAVQKWFGQAVGDILTVPDKVLKEGTGDRK